jgi:hypothetical protein
MILGESLRFFTPLDSKYLKEQFLTGKRSTGMNKSFYTTLHSKADRGDDDQNVKSET